MATFISRFNFARTFTHVSLLIALLWVLGSRQAQVTAAPNAPIIVEVGWSLVQSVAVDTPSGAHYNPQDGLVYVARRVTGSTGGLYRINGDGTLTQVAVGDRPAGVVIDFNDGDIFFSEDYGGNLYRHGFADAIPSRNTWVAGMHSGDDDPIGMAIAPNDYIGPVLTAGQAIVVDRGNSGTDEIWGWSPDTAEGEVQLYTDSASGGTLIDALDVAVTNEAIYLVDGKGTANGAIYRLISNGTLEQVSTAIVFNEPAGIAATPNNDLLIADSATDKIVRLDPDSGAVSDLFTGFGNLSWVSVDMSPDGKTVVVTDSTAEYVYIFRDTRLTVNSASDEADGDTGDGNCDVDLGSTGDQCTLRAAIEQANARPGHDLIVFNISGETYSIQPLSPLPALTDVVTIDGSSQPGTVCPFPNIEINGSVAGSGSDGLILSSSGNTIKGLMINNFSGNGLTIPFGSNNNTIQCNFIGTNGYDSLGNGGHGLKIDTSQGNIIGGLLVEESNLISGNGADGIYISGTFPPGNLVQGNLIGLDAAGISAIPNLQHGLEIVAAAENSIGPGNVISGNGQDGIHISHLYSTGNLIRGNIIGLSFSGGGAIGNGNDGMKLVDAPQNIIGGVGQGNVVSGNLGNGIVLTGTVATDNVVQGNLIGTDPAGTTPFGNNYNGLAVVNGQQNLIGGLNSGEGNLISGNGWDGLLILQSNGNDVQGNKIGTDAAGNLPLGNGWRGIAIDGQQNLIAQNLISANGQDGVLVAYASSSNNLIQGNKIGTDSSGTVDLGNGENGIELYGAPYTTIGGPTTNLGNLISGNEDNGLYLTYHDTDYAHHTTIQNNIIGTDATGTAILGNNGSGIELNAGNHNLIGGVGAGNLISGNSHGIVIVDGGGHIIQGNKIGTNGAGTAALANWQSGLYIFNSGNNLIGGPAGGQGNLISGNNFTGIYLAGSYANGNVIQGNKIGTDITGEIAVANGPAGYAVGGIRLFASNTLIGGTEAGAGNLISGNFGWGVEIGLGGQATVQGNYIGTNGAGLVALPNSGGVYISHSGDNIIGGTIPTAGNLISGNNYNGLSLNFASSDNNVIQGNAIGANAAGAFSLGNGGVGLKINDAPNNLIGGDEDGAGNRIGGNVGNGIEISGSGATGNQLRANVIGENGELGIDLGADGVTLNDAGDGDGGPNNGQNFPLLGLITAGGGIVHIQASLDTVSNTVQILDFYSSPSCDPAGYGEGSRYLGTITASTDSSGQLLLDQNLGSYAPIGHFVTAIATGPAGNSSEFSPCSPVVQATGKLSGWVQGPTETLLSGGTVSLFLNVANGDQTAWYLTEAQTIASDGFFNFADLPIGNYLILARDNSNTFASEYWLDSDNLGLATTVTVSESVAISLPLPIELTAGGSISGTVTSESTGLPLAGIKVTAVFDNGGSWQAYRTATTTSNGRYLIGSLPAGTYRLYFNDPKRVYNSEYYDNTLDFNLASTVNVLRLLTTTDINATLKKGSPIVNWDTTSTTDTPCTVQVLSNNRILIRRHRSHPSCQLNLTTPPSLVSCGVGINPVNVQLLSENNVYELSESPAGSGSYNSGLITLASTWSSDRNLALNLQWSCESVLQSVQIGNFQLYDPSGIVSDLNTGLPIAGATVTLYNVPDWRARTHADDVAVMTCESNLSKAEAAPWSQTAPTLLGVVAIPLPSLIDPTLTSQITDSEGYYGWDVAAGCWYVVVEAEGYETLVSPVVGVPTEVTDLDLMLRPESPTAIQLLTIRAQRTNFGFLVILLIAGLLLGWQTLGQRMKNN